MRDSWTFDQFTGNNPIDQVILPDKLTFYNFIPWKGFQKIILLKAKHFKVA